MIDAEILKILCCPETHQPLRMADDARVAEVNRQIAAGQLKDGAGKIVSEKIDGGLLREDGKVLYPIRNGLPILLIDEALKLVEV